MKNQKGQGLVEYLIIVAIIAVGTLGIMRILGQTISVKFAQVAKSMGAKTEGNLIVPEVTESMLKRKDMADFMRGSGLGTKNE